MNGKMGFYEVDSTQAAFEKILSKTRNQLIKWTKEVILKHSPVYLELYRYVHEENQTGTSPPLANVLREMENNIALISMDDTSFVVSGHATALSIWARQTHFIEKQLRCIPLDMALFPDVKARQALAFDVIKFLNKNMSASRFLDFKGGKIPEADAARAELVKATKWDVSKAMNRTASSSAPEGRSSVPSHQPPTDEPQLPRRPRAAPTQPTLFTNNTILDDQDDSEGHHDDDPLDLENESDLEDLGNINSSDYVEFRNMMSAKKLVYSKATGGKAQLRKAYGGDVEIIHRLPIQNNEDPDNPGSAKAGMRHKPHEITFLHWALRMEATIKGGIKEIGCDTRKMHEIISLIEGATLYWERKGRPANKPNLIVVPKDQLTETIGDLQNQLGVQWRVFPYGQTKGQQHRVPFSSRHPLFGSPHAGRSVAVVSLSQLQRVEPTHELNGLFERIVIDEAHAIRRFANTVQGNVLKCFNAQFRWLFTDTVIVDTVLDIDGYLAFLERPFWAEETDVNATMRSQEKINFYREFAKYLESEDYDGPQVEAPCPPDWNSQCSSITLLDKEDVAEKRESTWLCSHWPVELYYNRDRAPSMDQNLGMRGKAGSLSGRKSQEPFRDNPYNLYHAKKL